MYVNWTPRLRRYIINQWKLGITPISEIARNRRVPRRTVYYLIERYKRYCYDGLEPKPKGRKKEHLNPKFAQLIDKEWKKHKCGSHKMWLRLKSMGFNVSDAKYKKYLTRRVLRQIREIDLAKLSLLSMKGKSQMSCGILTGQNAHLLSSILLPLLMIALAC